MKSKIILLVVSFVFAIQSQAQIETKVFTLNLGEPTLNSLRDSVNSNSKLVIKAKEPLAFKLVNGNPYKYKYVINHKLVNFFEGQGYNPIDSVGKIIGNPNISNKVVDEKTKLENKIKVKEQELKKVEAEINDTNLKSVNNKSILLSKKLAIKSEIDSLQNELKNRSMQSSSQYISQSFYSANIINETKLNNLLKSITKAINAKNEVDDKKNIKSASIVLKQAFDDLKIDIDNYVSEISAEDFLNKDSLIAKRQNFNSAYIKLLQNIQGIGNEASAFTDVLEDFNKKTAEINPISLKIKDEISKMYQLKLYNYLLPVDINGKNIDVVEVTVERYDKNSTNPTPDKYTYNIWVKGGVKIDISGGLFLTSLMDKEYETKDDGSKKFIFEKNRGDYEFGFGSTINVSLRGGSWVRPGLSIGALFTTNQKFQLLTGLGFIIGKEERIVLHTGLSMGRISRISDNYKTDGSVSYDLGTEGTLPMTEKFSFGHFFGLTYNFGKVKKQDENN
ncbi:hypothetical protein [Flavobacterium sp.]|uniref:hypothetical protein n=1 Tax=Flavobacterium sp. TaxID=239 RepID=UPI003B9B4FE1